MSYFIKKSGNNCRPEDLEALRLGRFDEIAFLNKTEISKWGSIPLRRMPISYDPIKGQKFLEIFSEISFPYRFHLDKLLIEGFSRELQYFAISLDAYIESGFTIPAEKIIYLASLGSYGSSVLKNARKEFFKRKISAINFCDSSLDPLVEDLIKDLPLDDIDVIFNYRHMPLWEEDLNDLEEVMNIPVQTSPEILEEFKESLKNLLELCQPAKEDNRLDILLASSRSISLEKGSKIRNFLRTQDNLSYDKNFSKSIGEVVRSKIPVYPQGYRDSVILDWKSLNTVRLIEFRVRKILEFLPNQNYTDSEQEFLRATRKFYTPGYSYICRDIRKEGLTKPRILLKIMLQEIAKKDPVLEPFIDFYDSFTYKEYGTPLRGHGQGMANALTTLMQVVIIQMINDRLISQGFEEIAVALNYNDDNVTKIHPDILDEFWDIEDKIMKGLGLLRADHKSFHSNQGYIFCENYISPFYPKANTKNMVRLRNIFFCLLYDFPYEAKEYLKGVGDIDLLLRFFPEIIHKFGYEFFPEEVSYPLSLGGWMPDQIHGFSTALLDLDNLPFDIRVLKMFKASKITTSKVPLPKRISRRYKEGRSIFDRIFPSFAKEIGKYLPVGKWSSLYKSYGLWRDDPPIDFSVRSETHKRRRKEYLRREREYPTLSSFREELIQSGKYILPADEIKLVHPEFFVKNLARDPYKHDTPLENFLRKIGASVPVSSPFSEEYSIRATNYNLFLRKDEIYQTLLEDLEVDLDGIPFHEESFYSIDRTVDRTADCLLAYYKVYGKIPILPYSLKENEIKKEVYGEFLSLDQFIEMADATYDRWDFGYFKKIESLIQIKDISESELDELIRDSKLEDESSVTSSPVLSSSEDEEEIRKSVMEYLQRTRNRQDLNVDSLVQILLGNESADNYEYSAVISPLISPVMFFYYHRRHDYVKSTVDREKEIREAFKEFLEIPRLKSLLQDALKEGYLEDLGVTLGLIEPKDDLDDYGITLFG